MTCFKGYFLILNDISLIIIIINIIYWLFMESFVRKEQSKEVGNKESKIISFEYKNTSKLIVFSIICLYFFCLFIRFFSFQLYPIKEYSNCSISLQFTSLYFLIPIFFSFFSFLLRYWSMKTLGVYFSRKLVVQGKQSIINEGPYSYVRHPGYLANVIMFLCYSIVVSGDFLLGLLIWGQYMITLLLVRIPIEEEMLLSNEATSENYRKYKSIVKYRIIPFII